LAIVRYLMRLAKRHDFHVDNKSASEQNYLMKQLRLFSIHLALTFSLTSVFGAEIIYHPSPMPIQPQLQHRAMTGMRMCKINSTVLRKTF